MTHTCMNKVGNFSYEFVRWLENQNNPLICSNPLVLCDFPPCLVNLGTSRQTLTVDCPILDFEVVLRSAIAPICPPPLFARFDVSRMAESPLTYPH